MNQGSEVGGQESEIRKPLNFFIVCNLLHNGGVKIIT